MLCVTLDNNYLKLTCRKMLSLWSIYKKVLLFVLFVRRILFIICKFFHLENYALECIESRECRHRRKTRRTQQIIIKRERGEIQWKPIYVEMALNFTKNLFWQVPICEDTYCLYFSFRQSSLNYVSWNI